MTAEEFAAAYEIARKAGRNLDEYEVHNRVVDSLTIDPTFEDSETIVAITRILRDDDESVRIHRRNFDKYMEAKANG